MELFYTGALQFEGEQRNKEQSLGGFPSNSPLPNGQLGNIFSDISLYTIDNGEDIFQMIGIVLKNTSGATVYDIMTYFTYPDDEQANIEIAAVDLSLDDDGNYYMESIPNSNSLPLYATFYEADGVANAINIGDLGDGEYVGLWLKRTINQSNIEALYTCDALNTKFEADETLPKSEQVSFIVDWSDESDSSS